MIQKFRKKPVEIEAIQWNGNTNKKERLILLLVKL